MSLTQRVLLLIPMYLLGLTVACQPGAPGENKISQPTQNGQATISMDITRLPVSQPTILPAISTSVPAETMTAVGSAPIRLNEGTFIFHPQHSPDDFSKVMLDFEQQKFDLAVSGNDIRMDLASGEYPIILVRPINGAAGMYVKTVKPGVGFDLNSYYDECLQNANEFLTGTEPVDYPGDLFCYTTHEHHLAVFVIEGITGTLSNWDVEIKYIVWDKIVR